MGIKLGVFFGVCPHTQLCAHQHGTLGSLEENPMCIRGELGEFFSTYRKVQREQTRQGGLVHHHPGRVGGGLHPWAVFPIAHSSSGFAIAVEVQHA
jgi:hypothetical protein